MIVLDRGEHTDRYVKGGQAGGIQVDGGPVRSVHHTAVAIQIVENQRRIQIGPTVAIEVIESAEIQRNAGGGRDRYSAPARLFRVIDSPVPIAIQVREDSGANLHAERFQ